MDDRERTRRRFLAAAGTGITLGFAGCSGQTGSNPTDTTTPTPTTTPTATETATETAEPTETTESPTETEESGPGYKNDHWHGRLFFKVNGELVDFDQPKYYLENLESEQPETVYFHFHEDEDAHGPNEWSNEKQVVTFQRALNLLPGIGYERRSGEHVVTYEGTTYDARQGRTTISIKEGDETIDPASYEVQHADHYYVQVTTEDTKRSVEPTHGGADLGTLLFDMNNIRVDFSREKYLGPDVASEAFHFHDDAHPYMWYKEGSVTLAEALNALPGIGYSKRSGNHVVEYRDEQRPDYSRTYDANRLEHEITIKQRTKEIDPERYEPRAGDIIWLYVKSSVIPENEH